MSEPTSTNPSAREAEAPAESPPPDPAPAVAGPEAAPVEREPVLGLSLTQVVGGSAAAATAAALGSRLGLVGTVVGAALISVVTAVAGAVYSHSLQRTREAVARTAERLPTVRVPVQRTAGRATAAPDPTAGGRPARASSSDEASGDADAGPRRWRRVGWKPVAVTAVVVFLLAGGIVTGIEALTGRSFNGDGRTSVGELIGRDPTPSRALRAPSDDASPSDRGTTGGSGNGDSGDRGEDRSSGSPATEQPTPTPTPTAEPTDGSTGSGSATPTPQPSSTPTPTSSPTSGTRR